MSSTVYAAPLRLERVPSRWLAAFVIMSHVGALLLIPPLSLSFWGKGLLAALIVLSGIVNLYRHVYLLARHSIVALLWDKADDWHLLTRGGQTLTAHLLPDSYIHPYLVILRFKARLGRQHWNVALFPDSLDAETFRHLRVRLRITN